MRDSLARLSNDAAARLRQDSLSVELAKVFQDSVLHAEKQLPTPEYQRFVMGNTRATQLLQAEDSLAVTGFSVGWVSLEYRVDNSAFRLFDPSLPSQNQITKRSFATHSAGLRYSRYQFSEARFDTRFLSASAHVSRSHNLNDLAQTEVTDRTTFGSDTTQRISENKYTAYIGKYRKGFTSLTLATDFYQFLFHKNQGAVHVYPTAEIRRGGAPVYNLGFGFLIAARKSARDASIVNAELFYDLTDLTNARDSEENLLGRSGLGLRVSFPITFRQEI
jgi:hypothetical protein